MDILNELMSGASEVMSISAFIISVIAAMGMGVLFSAVIQYKHTVSKSFALTTAMLPAVVSVVIMMVNGSIGAGIAVAGTFSLVRFRSVPGTAREILIVFVAMAIGLACGMGSVAYALIFTMMVSVAILLLERSSVTEIGSKSSYKTIRITIPEDLDYTDIFSDLFDDYLETYELKLAKSINLGSMFRLTYDVVFKDAYEEKEFLDQVRMRNGNLEVSCSVKSSSNDEL